MASSLPCFPEQEAEVVVLCIQEHLQRCCWVLQAVCSALLSSTAQNQPLVDRHHTPAPTYTQGKKSVDFLQGSSPPKETPFR